MIKYSVLFTQGHCSLSEKNSVYKPLQNRNASDKGNLSHKIVSEQA